MMVRCPKKEKSLISIGPQFHTLFGLTGALVAELGWAKKKNRQPQNVTESLITQAGGIKKRLSGKLKVERL
jgi:hypothetical protein